MRSPLSFTDHPRDDEHAVYAVLSRRAGGISLGIDLNPDHSCNFDCVYCQVDRRTKVRGRVDPERLERDLRRLLSDAREGRLAARVCSEQTPAALARVVELAIAGNGEPTLHPEFERLASLIARTLRDCDDELPLVLFTNATTFQRPSVRRGLDAIEAAGGRVLAKLDAGTPAGYASIDRGRPAFDQVVRNLSEYAARAPLWIQSMFVEIDGHVFSDVELNAFVRRLVQIDAGAGRIVGIEVGTTARTPAVASVRPVSTAVLERIALRIRASLPELPVQIVPGAAELLPAV